MRLIKIKNNQTITDSYCGIIIDSGEYYTIQNEIERQKLASDEKLNTHIWSDPSKVIISDGDDDLDNINGDSWLKGNYVETVVTEQPEPAPFAQPTYRTKHDATTTLIDIAKDSSGNIDFALSAERYVSGGKMIIKNAEMGDYITACVYDYNSVIPEAYRTALCENWPIVSEYVTKRWIEIVDSNSIYTVQEIDTRPLNAKITAGLYLRISYHATAEGTARKIGVNYDLTTKL